ncbi:MAG: metallophosphoesterase [Myxococcota bacterium]|nr:metallophosphoesterase [Myxococcota bacterium]
MRIQSVHSAVVFSVLLSCGGQEAPFSASASPTTSDPIAEIIRSQSPESIRFAVVGDYGTGDEDEAGVARMIAKWEPQVVLTAGDNNYPVGASYTIDSNIGAFYSEYIHPYKGRHGPGAAENRFFPALGNHDWMLGNIQPYEEYFQLPGNERYYTVERGPVAFFIIDSDPHEPDGIDSDSIQARWLRVVLAASDAAFRVVIMHHPPFSSGRHGSQKVMQWPYKAWGADLVIAGHDHTYERIEVDGLTYLVNGLGGRGPYRFREPISGSQVRFNKENGALLVEATAEEMIIRFVTSSNVEIDRFRLPARPRVRPSGD